MDSVGEGEGGKIWENGIETCKISCMKRDASPGSMHDTGCLGLVHWDDSEGWYGEGGGRRVQDGEHMYTNKKNKKINKIHFFINDLLENPEIINKKIKITYNKSFLKSLFIIFLQLSF